MGIRLSVIARLTGCQHNPSTASHGGTTELSIPVGGDGSGVEESKNAMLPDCLTLQRVTLQAKCCTGHLRTHMSTCPRMANQGASTAASTWVNTGVRQSFALGTPLRGMAIHGVDEGSAAPFAVLPVQPGDTLPSMTAEGEASMLPLDVATWTREAFGDARRFAVRLTVELAKDAAVGACTWELHEVVAELVYKRTWWVLCVVWVAWCLGLVLTCLWRRSTTWCTATATHTSADCRSVGPIVWLAAWPFQRAACQQ